jgi:hypothetical protein
MNKLALLATAASLATLALASTASAASFTGWYGGVEAGANWVPNQNGVDDTIDPTFTGGYTNKTEFDTGWAIMGSAGYSFGPWRTELELGYRSNDISKYVVPNASSTTQFSDGGDVHQFTVMANALYDINVTPDYQLSLGGGVGADFVGYKNPNFHTDPIKDSDTVFAWQLMAGVSRFMPYLNADVVLNYRYLQTDSVSFTEVDHFGDLHNDNYSNLDNHAVTLGLRWH